MTRVFGALAVHELLERTRDRWVLVVSTLFALLASAVSVYGRSTEAQASTLTGPSLVTLASLLVPLVALVLSHDAIVGERERNTLGLLLSLPVRRGEVVAAKVLGRGVALTLAVSAGIGAAVLLSEPAEGQVLLQLLGPTLLLGLAFLSLGMLISTLVTRQVTAASLVVVIWFLLVFFYDVGLLGLLIVTDGGVPQWLVVALVAANPAGLYRVAMMRELSGPEVLEGMGLSASVPEGVGIGAIWIAWIVGPVLLSALSLSFRRNAL